MPERLIGAKMNLVELCSLGLPGNESSVPDFTFGCFRRRSITFFDARTDTATEVLWLQSRGLTADLRIYAGRPALADARELGTRFPDELAALAEAEGGLARTRWDGRAMHWEGWSAFQIHAKWPEPGVLQRVGDCLVEFAPSGAYVEDWRAQPAGDGVFVGLELLDESDAATGEVLHRGGGLVVCGRHAAFVRGRPRELVASASTLAEMARQAAGDRAKLDAIFAFEASYAQGSNGVFSIVSSTRPWRHGQPLIAWDGFEYDASAGLVVQRAREAEREVVRRFRVDTLSPRFPGAISTEVDPAGAEWLSREADTLLRSAR